MRRRVAITGVGAVSAAAPDTAGFVEALREGRRSFSPLDDPRLAELDATHAGLIHGALPPRRTPTDAGPFDRHVELALVALGEALDKAGLGDSPLGARSGIVIGTCSGGMLSIERHYEALARGEEILDDRLLFDKRYHSAARVLAWAAGAGGPALTVVTACAAGAGAIAQGADLIRAGLVDTVVAGGSDSFAPSTLSGFDVLGATCRGTCEPFSTNVGLNLGEGSALLILEEWERARERGAEPLAELLGSGLSNDAYHPTAPDPTTKGQLASMSRALGDAGVGPEVVSYVNAHGTGTRANDPAESRAIAKLLKERGGTVPVSSTKSMIGHCLGAAGALETSASLLALGEGFLPPTAGFSSPREGCHLDDYVPDAGRPFSHSVVLTNSFGFGGNNACLLLDTDPADDRPRGAPPGSNDAKAKITGIGLVSPLGFGVEALADGSATGIVEIDRFPAPCRPFPAGLVPRIDPRSVDRRLDLKGMDLSSSYATVAARAALADAALKPRPAAMAEVGMVLGLAAGPSQGEMDHLRAVFEGGFALDSLGGFPFITPNEVAGQAARALLLKGHNTVLAAGRGAGLAALISAAIAVEQGHGDTVLAAAADELTERTLADGYLAGTWGPGTVVTPGEGAAALLVESPDAVAARGGEPRAEILGFSLATDTDDPRRCGGEALVRALIEALERARVSPGEIRAVAPSSGIPAGRCVERMFLDQVLGKRDPRVVSVAPRVGLAEATLPLYNLSVMIASSEPGDRIAATFRGLEGLAGAVILRVE